jgi:DNA repair protein RecN (Recombination protein N)
MLTELRIRHLGVIDEAELALEPGLTVLTGETGAGKTMVLTALGLLLGGRADAATVRTDAHRAEVEGVFEVSASSQPAVRAVDAGADLDDGLLVVGRTVAAAGRSRAVLGGRTVPTSVLVDLADDLVAVHGQSSQVALVRSDRQRSLLDDFGGALLLPLRDRVGDLYRQLRAVEGELTDIRTRARERAREADLLRHGLAEIEQVSPVSGEDDELAAEEGRLAHADRLREAADRARIALSGDESDVTGADALSAVAAARQSVDGARELDPTLDALAERLASASYALVDVAADLSSYLADLDLDPARLAVVAERRAALAHLYRRYGDDIPAVLAWAEHAAGRLATLDDDEGRLQALDSQRAALQDELGKAAGALSAERTRAADRLATAVTEELHSLAMGSATFGVTVSQRDDPDGISVGDRCVACSATGVDQVEFTLCAHPSAPPRPLGKGASGGELSRTMLALEVVLADADPVPTLVFDEVDAGVGGRAAVEVGRRLARLARHAQVLVVTHLPQVAAFADHHYQVHRDTSGHITASGVRKVDSADRAAELARMMAGLEASDVALEHAQELLDVASAERSLDPGRK